MASKKETELEILKDVDSLTTWLEKRNAEIRNGGTDVVEGNMPVLARVICGGEEEFGKLDMANREKYTKYFKDNKKTASALTLATPATKGMDICAIASGTGAAGAFAGMGVAGAGALGFSATAGLGLAGMGAAAFIPALWPIGISLLAISAGSVFAKSKREKENAKRTEKLEEIFNSCQTGAQECNNKIDKNNKKIKEILTQKLKKSVEALANASKKIAINIDDALHSDQNLRIMQYQEIVLKQYNNQNEIREMLADLIEAYNKLVAENEQLAKQVAAYEANMRMCGCTNNYLA